MTNAQYQRGFVAKRTAEHNAGRSQRMRAGKPNRADIAQMVAAYEHMTKRPPITLPRLSIQDDAE